MREIKFRGKNYENKWKYGDLVQEKWGQGKAIMIKKDKRAWSVLEDTVGQYTGLHDKNGKEIYEGDIVLYEDWEMCYEGGGNDSFINKGIIEYCNSNCCFNVTERQTTDLQDVLYEGNEDLEVIGNIYDDPNLLEKEGE
jgi:uncharacterized phage protein (TIGR01671 family)